MKYLRFMPDAPDASCTVKRIRSNQTDSNRTDCCPVTHVIMLGKKQEIQT